MEKIINLGMNVELRITNTSFAESFSLVNKEAQREIDLGMRLK